MPSIYELTEEYRALEEAAYNDEMTYEEFDALLSAIEGDIEGKVDGYCKVIASLKSDAERLAEEARRITMRKQSLLRAVDRLKETMLYAMDAQGRNKIKTALFTASISNRTALEITDLTCIPPEFIKPITEDGIMKREITAMLKETGEVLPYARLVSKRGLTIR